jgi:hypothetical protein
VLFLIALVFITAILYKAVNRHDLVKVSSLLSINTAIGLLVSFLQGKKKNFKK